jgi:hypothetical protein
MPMTRPYIPFLPYYCRIAYVYLYFSFLVFVICFDARINCISYKYYLDAGMAMLLLFDDLPE